MIQIDAIAIVIIILATVISISGAWCVSGSTNNDRRVGFKLWQWSNFFWIVTFIMGVFGYISSTVFIIQQFCAGLTFIVYFISNLRGEKNNGNC